MKISELRIGNFVTIDNPISWLSMKGIPLTVTGIENIISEEDKKMFSHSEGRILMKSEFENYRQFSQFVVPIPLTEDWLHNFGFTKKGEFWFEKNGITVESTTKGIVYFLYPSVLRLKSVHQLQNFYFALTGEELELQ